MTKEIDTIYGNRRTFNSGYIFFDDSKKAHKWIDVLKRNHVEYINYIQKESGKVIYGFKMFRMKKQFFRICIELEEVIKC